MRRTSLIILAGALAFDLGVMAVAAQAQQTPAPRSSPRMGTAPGGGASDPAFIETCNLAAGDPCVTGDCSGGDILRSNGAWYPDPACRLTRLPEQGTSAIRARRDSSTDAPSGGASDGPQERRSGPRIPTTSTGPTFPGPQLSTVAPGVPACAPGERPPCHGPRNPWLPGGPAGALSGPPPADEGPGPYDPYPREDARAARVGPSGPRSDPPPGGCVLRPGNPMGCGDGEGPAAIGDTTAVITISCLPFDPHTLDTVPEVDVVLKICLPPKISTTTCTGSGGTVEQADGQTACTLPSANVARFRSAVARQSASDARRRGGTLPLN